MRNLTTSALLLLAIYSTAFSQSAATRIPIWTAGFVENKGQVRDQNYIPNTDVRFVYTDGKAFNLQLKPDGFSYQLFMEIPLQQGLPESGPGSFDQEEQDYEPFMMLTHRIDVKLIGANPKPEIIGVDRSETVFNFYTTGDATRPILNVSGFSEVIYKNIYPNIDLVFSSADGSGNSALKYSWIVRKGGNPSKIRLQYDGQNGMVANDDGTVSIHTPVGTVSEGKLISYWQDNGSTVPSSYSIRHDHVQYDVAAKINKTLIIDPNIVWAVDYGGESGEFVSEGELALDSKNNTLITGNTRSTLYMATTGAYQTSFAGGDSDAFLAKMQAAGNLSWATYFGGTENDEGHATAVDIKNNVYLAGLTHSVTGIATPGTYQPTYVGGTSDAYLAKFNSKGILQWSTYYGGTSTEQINSMTCDSKGNIYFVGFTTSSNGIATPGAYQDTINNSESFGGDAMVGEFDSHSNLVWASYLGGPSTDRGHAICLGNNEELYIHGTCESETQFASGNVFQTTYGGGPADAFVARWDTNGNFYWCSYYGGEGDDHGRGVTVDEEDNLYIVGWTDSDSAMGSSDGIQPKWSPKFGNDGSRVSDGYLAKFNPIGQRVWGTYYGGSGKDQMKGVVADKTNSYVYAAGISGSHNNISTPGAFEEELNGSSDGMLLKANYDGTRVWGTYVGTENSDKFEDIQQDADGFLYCLMEEGGDFPVTPNTNLTNYRGASETIVIKFSPFDQCQDTYENNETKSTSRKIIPYEDSTLYGYNAAIAGATDQDWFKIKIPTTNNLKVVLTDLPKDYNLNLYTIAGQTPILSSAHTGLADEQIIFNAVPAGNYNLEIAHTSTEFDPNNCYRLKIILNNTPWLLKNSDDGSERPMTPTDLFAHAVLLSGYFNMNITSAFSASAQITLANSFGQQVYSTVSQLNPGVQSLRIPAENLPSGIYFIRIKTEFNSKVVLKVANLK